VLRKRTRGHGKIVALLLTHGAHVDRRHGDGSTPLVIACQNNHKKIVRMLIENGADFQTLVQGETPLIVASRYGHLDIVKLPLEKGADIN
jgi:ankyrin repeat protein